MSPSLGPSVLSPLCGLSTAVARLGSGTVLAFMRRQKGERLVLDAHRRELAGVRDVEHRAATPQQLGTGPQVCLRSLGKATFRSVPLQTQEKS